MPKSAHAEAAFCAADDKNQAPLRAAAQDEGLNQTQVRVAGDRLPRGQRLRTPTSTMEPPENQQGRPSLALHLGVVLALKFALLALLWYLLIMPYRVEIDAPAMGERLTQTASQSNLKVKEQAHDRSGRR